MNYLILDLIHRQLFYRPLFQHYLPFLPKIDLQINQGNDRLQQHKHNYYQNSQQKLNEQVLVDGPQLIKEMSNHSYRSTLEHIVLYRQHRQLWQHLQFRFLYQFEFSNYKKESLLLKNQHER